MCRPCLLVQVGNRRIRFALLTIEPGAFEVKCCAGPLAGPQSRPDEDDVQTTQNPSAADVDDLQLTWNTSTADVDDLQLTGNPPAADVYHFQPT